MTLLSLRFSFCVGHLSIIEQAGKLRPAGMATLYALGGGSWGGSSQSQL